MASKTKADFIKEGVRAFLMGNTNGAMPVFGEGTSWQARAFAEGFRQEAVAKANREEGAAIAADIENEGEARRSKPVEVQTTAEELVHTLRMKRAIPGPLVEHYSFLMRTAATCSDPVRALRLRSKASKLRNKWTTRVMARA